MMHKKITHLKNSKQQVFAKLHAEQKTVQPMLSRRAFCSLASLSVITATLPACSSYETDIKRLSEEIEFGQFFDILFPAADLGLQEYRQRALTRLQRLSKEQVQQVNATYQRFKSLLWVKSDLNTQAYTTARGEACLSELLQSTQAKQYNHALDIIYYELSKDKKLITALWGRKFSVTDKKCVYWDNYDKAVS